MTQAIAAVNDVNERAMPQGPAVLRYGASIKLEHRISGYRLHSHLLNYSHPGSTGQQQVTCFAGRDDNDWWLLKEPTWEDAGDFQGDEIRHGSYVRLEHVLTRRNLHSTPGLLSPVTVQQEVSCYGEAGNGDYNDHWRVEVAGAGPWTERSVVRLIHLSSNAALHSHFGYSHPAWTAGQQEVTGFAGRDDNDLWQATDLRTHDARFISQVVPATLIAGETASVSVTMRNVGTRTWLPAEGFRLGSQSPQDNATWGTNRVELPGAVAPGDPVTIEFEITAPAGRSVATFHWAMVQDGVSWFGEGSTPRQVRIFTSAGPTTVPDVTGQPRVVATKAITAADLVPALHGWPRDPREVLSQHPAGGTSVQRGSTVDLQLVRSVP